jgi:hypothetical protein
MSKQHICQEIYIDLQKTGTYFIVDYTSPFGTGLVSTAGHKSYVTVRVGQLYSFEMGT